MPLNTLLDLQNDVKLRLGEAQNTPVGALKSGTGNTLVFATDATITQYVNEALADLCKRGGLVIDATAAPASNPAVGTEVIPYANLSTTTTGERVWTVTDVTYNAVRLQRIGRGMANIYRSSSLNSTLYYYYAGQEALGFCLPVVTSAALSVRALIIPATLTNTTDTITAFLEPDLRRLLSCYACHYIALKALEDETLAARVTPWMNEYEAGRLALLGRLLKEDPTTYAAHYSQVAQMTGK